MGENTSTIPKIKPLTWQKVSVTSYFAETPVASFEVWYSEIMDNQWRAICDGKDGLEFETEAMAKEYCESVYKQRIIDCLE